MSPESEHVVTVVTGSNSLQFSHCNDVRLCHVNHCSLGWQTVENPATGETVEDVTLCLAEATGGKTTVCMIQTNNGDIKLLEKTGILTTLSR